LVKLINHNFSIKEIAAELEAGYSTVRKYLKIHEIVARSERGERQKTPRKCLECGETDIDKFYKGKKICCKNCFNRACIARQLATKLRGIEYKGGKCSNCGYDKYFGALEFHHLDPTKKESMRRTWSWPRFKKEIDKCILLCSNCHREEHAKLRS